MGGTRQSHLLHYDMKDSVNCFSKIKIHYSVTWANYSTRKRNIWQLFVVCLLCARNVLGTAVWLKFSDTIRRRRNSLFLPYVFLSCLSNNLLGRLGHFARDPYLSYWFMIFVAEPFAFQVTGCCLLLASFTIPHSFSGYLKDYQLWFHNYRSKLFYFPRKELNCT